MNVSKLQLIDRWCGMPLCFLLTFFRRIFPKRPPGRDEAVHSVLFVKLAEQGSTVLAHSAIQRAIETVGREKVYFLVFDDNRFVLDAMAVIPEANVITISFSTVLKLISSTLRAIRTIRRLELDAALDLEFFTRGSAVLTFLSGAARRVGFHPFFNAGPYRGDLMTHRLLYNPHLHTAETFRLMVEALDHDPLELPTRSEEHT